ncbi:NAD(P)H-binding [Teratosphaeria destructans]|uniref:NAD(P)H-binding n=1 Tax=Teratosphaeria destructans TaxID=418781 RepID=A0A9W7W1N5_9PEZI|nr:NAD(P)H-binding [Teratosphaeria destructans]
MVFCKTIFPESRTQALLGRIDGHLLTPPTVAMSIRNVALVGADGNLGPAILQALVKAGFQVTILKRESSKSRDNYPSVVRVIRVDSDFDTASVAKALVGQDAVVVSMRGAQQVDVQKRIADACIVANVNRMIPADFGSCDSSSAVTQELVPLYRNKTTIRNYLQGLSAQHSNFTWTSLVCGHFFDWSLEFIHIFVHDQRADILGDGNTPCSFSTLARIAEATVAVLQRPRTTANQMLYIHSFLATQNEIVDAYQRATDSTWNVTSLDSEKFKNDEKAKADAGDLNAIEELVWYLGTVDANWTTRENFAMEKLGLKDESLDFVVQRIVGDCNDPA